MVAIQGEPLPPPGAVELREDAPLKAGGGGAAGGAAGPRCCAGGPRLALACFAALSAAITLALFTQIYYGDYEVVPHGSVSSAAAACSGAGAAALKAGGGALDAAAVAALCLAVAAPHRTSLDASGSLLYWEYRQSRTQLPLLAEWGGAPLPAEAAAPQAAAGERPPRLVAALAVLHAEYGALPWPRLLQPAIDLARNGFPVSEGLALALAAETASGSESGTKNEQLPPGAGSLSTAPLLAAFLEALQRNTSAELAAAWGAAAVRRSEARAVAAGAARVFAGGAGGPPAARALALALDPPPADVDDAERRVVEALSAQAARGEWAAGGVGVGSGLAAVDARDTYLALVTGLSQPFGSGPATAAGWTRDLPARDLDLAPAIIVGDRVCGPRFVVGAEGGAALAQAGAALAAGGGAAGVERARLQLRGAALAAERAPAPAVNLVQQDGDELLSHADSRGGGLASRF